MTPAQAWLVTTLPDNTTELPQMTDTQPDQSKSLPGVISTDKTGISTNLILETAPLTTEKDWTFTRPLPIHGDTFDNTNGPRCKNSYRLVVGTCIKLVGMPGIDWMFGKSHDGAKEACRKEGATLAMPKTKELDVALRDLVKRGGFNKEHWIGMEKKGGIWYWMDGSKVGHNGYKGWNPGEPGGWSCGHYWAKPSGWLFSGSGYPMWDDDACFKRKRFICQRPPA
ncbi:PREDICTED: C-type lectin lectoxin-Lio2-like [Branchiostoma belcheri]|uniref:C-type lectin lectoxin-Lio2-like n=1 Tax=Branchiostoma belcheri TaxID=7741 RepID=A0A6P4Z7A7_BRABE|nr:PREDICTED: C-type lectin lectoxin-Lio2-like [Branchiostoma belcheri]